MSEGNCLLQPSDQISPVVLVVPERNTEYNITARVDCSFRFSVKSGNDKGFCEEEPRQITVTEDTTGRNERKLYQNTLKSFRSIVYYFYQGRKVAKDTIVPRETFSVRKRWVILLALINTKTLFPAWTEILYLLYKLERLLLFRLYTSSSLLLFVNFHFQCIDSLLFAEDKSNLNVMAIATNNTKVTITWNTEQQGTDMVTSHDVYWCRGTLNYHKCLVCSVLNISKWLQPSQSDKLLLTFVASTHNERLFKHK